MHEKMPLLLRHGWVSTTEIMLGFLLSVVVGVPLALATFLWPAFARSVYPLLVSSQAVPKMAVAPLFIVWFGFGLMPKVFIAFLIAFFPIVINTVVGLAAIEPERHDERDLVVEKTKRVRQDADDLARPAVEHQRAAED